MMDPRNPSGRRQRPRVEHRTIAGQEVVVHFDDVPDKDRTVVQGIPCTTALRTVIDISPDVSDAELDSILQDCLDRNLFSVAKANARLAEKDMADRMGASCLREALRRRSG